jgi:hypothetical protein
VSLLERQELFFSRADVLGDPFEGSFSQMNLKMRPVWAEQAGLPADYYAGFEDARKMTIQETFINAWHASDVESAAMWSLYLRSEDGIAVRSTYRRLSEAFEPTSEHVYIGVVHYIDYDDALIPESNTFWPFVHKRKSYQHEREVRAVIQKFEYFENMRARKDPTWRMSRLHDLGIKDTPDLDLDEVLPLPPTGLYVAVDLSRLVEAVYVAPNAAEWFLDLVQSVMARYERPEPVHRSSLATDPVY